MSKPFPVEVLAARVREMISQSRTRKALNDIHTLRAVWL